MTITFLNNVFSVFFLFNFSLSTTSFRICDDFRNFLTFFPLENFLYLSTFFHIFYSNHKKLWFQLSFDLYKFSMTFLLEWLQVWLRISHLLMQFHGKYDISAKKKTIKMWKIKKNFFLLRLVIHNKNFFCVIQSDAHCQKCQSIALKTWNVLFSIENMKNCMISTEKN